MHAEAPGTGEGLFYEDTLPLVWREIETPPTAARLVNVYHANEQLLRYLAALEEHRADHLEEDHPQTAHELARLDLKINLLLEMVGHLLSRQAVLPDAVPLRLGADGLQWTAKESQVPAAGSHLGVDVYLNSKYPAPLTLFGKVASAKPVSGGHAVDLVYTDMDESLRTALEKMIFRQHRRLVAHVRRSGKS